MPEGLDWAAGKVRAKRTPSELHISSDEAKWFYWLRVEPLGDLSIGLAVAERDGYVLRLTTENLRQVSVNLAELAATEVVRCRLDGEAAEDAVTADEGGVVTIMAPDGGRHEWLLTLE